MCKSITRLIVSNKPGCGLQCPKLQGVNVSTAACFLLRPFTGCSVSCSLLMLRWRMLCDRSVLLLCCVSDLCSYTGFWYTRPACSCIEAGAGRWVKLILDRRSALSTTWQWEANTSHTSDFYLLIIPQRGICLFLCLWLISQSSVGAIAAVVLTPHINW